MPPAGLDASPPGLQYDDEEEVTARAQRPVVEEADERAARLAAKASNDEAEAHKPITTTASATLPVSAEVAFEAFGDAAETPRWLSVLHAARVIERDDQGRARRVAFVGRLERGSIGYTLDYQFDPHALVITWKSAPDAPVQVRGEVTFAPLSSRACLMTYSVSLHAPVGPWSDPSFEHHPASAIVTGFREHLRRG